MIRYKAAIRSYATRAEPGLEKSLTWRMKKHLKRLIRSRWQTIFFYKWKKWFWKIHWVSIFIPRWSSIYSVLSFIVHFFCCKCMCMSIEKMFDGCVEFILFLLFFWLIMTKHRSRFCPKKELTQPESVKLFAKWHPKIILIGFISSYSLAKPLKTLYLATPKYI